jgi:hypothetical protein
MINIFQFEASKKIIEKMINESAWLEELQEEQGEKQNEKQRMLDVKEIIEVARYKAEGFGADNATRDMTIVPVNFNKEHKAMLGHCKMILEHEPRKIAINPDTFGKLITSLRTAVDNDGILDKESTAYNGIFDAYAYNGG